MAEQSNDEFILGSWVRKQLEDGDDPAVLKTVLKNRGMDPAIVDDVLFSIKNNPPAKKSEVSLTEPKKTFINKTLRDDVDKILFSAKPDSSSVEIREPPAKKAKPEQNPVVGKESIFSLFMGRVREYLSGINFGSPKITEYIFDTRIVLLTGIAVAILIIALLISFGLNWYADWAARSVLN